MSRIQTILLPVDFSDCSYAAFKIARALAKDYHARLVILHIAEPPPFVSPEEFDHTLHQPDGYESELVDVLRLLYSCASVTGVEYRTEEGNPTVEILAAAREERCDLIVMGSHGRTGLGHMLMGSLAEKVVRKAPCPVLTVKIPLRVPSPRNEAAVPV